MNDIITQKFNTYPDKATGMALQLKTLIYEVAKDEMIDHIEESLKWGEPCFKAPNGSPVRIDWKVKTPENIYIFFICSTTLIETFKELYKDILRFEGNRGIVLSLKEELPTNILKHCFSLALRYHKIKDSSFLGA